MIYLPDEQVRQYLSFSTARAVLREAFIAQAQGRAAVLGRSRAGDSRQSLCAMGAVMPEADVMGAKLYANASNGSRSYVNVFSARSGRLRAVLEAESLTHFRTAALTSLAAEVLADTEAETLAVFGSGLQAWAHVLALAEVLPYLRRVLVVGIDSGAHFAERVHTRLGLDAAAASTAQALDEARVIVTATRATEPLFAGEAVRPGSFVAAIGANHPAARELDEALLRRADRLVVDGAEQAQHEAGELALLTPGARATLPLVELGVVLENPARYALRAGQVAVYKSVGVGLADIALAQQVLRERADGATPRDPFLGTSPPAR